MNGLEFQRTVTGVVHVLLGCTELPVWTQRTPIITTSKIPPPG